MCAPYLDQADKVWFASGLPVVGYFHDYEPSVEGIGWMAACLDGWEKAGARRFIDFRELAAALALRLEPREQSGTVILEVSKDGGVDLVRPFPVLVALPGGLTASRLTAIHRGMEQILELEQVGAEVARAWLDPSLFA